MMRYTSLSCLDFLSVRAQLFLDLKGEKLFGKICVKLEMMNGSKRCATRIASAT